MKKTDLGIAGVLYCIIIIFFIMASKLDEATRKYPVIILLILTILTTLFLIKNIYRYKKDGLVKDKVLVNFNKRQFIAILTFIFAYIILIFILGFYTSSILFVISSLTYLRVPKRHIIITTCVVLLIVYCAFTRFLGVNLPGFNLV